MNTDFKYLQAVLDSLGDAVVVLKDDGQKIEFVNAALYSMLGYGGDELEDKGISSLFKDGKDCPDFRAEVNAQCELRGKDGRNINAEIKAGPLNGETGPGRTVLLLRDITEAKNAKSEEDIKQIQSLQTYKMEAIGRFTAGLAHDFNNLLTGIQGFSKLALRRVNDGDPLKEDLEQIYMAAERTGILTRQLLFFSRKQPMKSREFVINYTLNNMSNIIKWLVGENIKVSMDLARSICLIFGDEIKIEQSIINLLLNARDAMPSGGEVAIKTENIEIGKDYVENFREAKCGKYVRITVKDNGAGMDKETLSHLFEPFFTTKDMKKGAGLGLFVAYGIVKQHEGWIDYDSKPGQGAVFQLYLPAVEPGARPKQESEKTVVLQDYHGNGEKILLIEDENVVRRFAFETLTMFGYKVMQAESGAGALELFDKENGKYDLVITDVVLNDTTGLVLAESFAKVNPMLKILMTSGYTDNKAEVQMISGKGYMFLQKPYSIEDLLQKVKEVILKHG